MVLGLAAQRPCAHGCALALLPPQIFAREHNLKPGWVGLGNQLNGVRIIEPEMRERYEARYGRAGPDGVLPPPS